LKNRDGETVSLESRRQLAYAVWTFGRTSDPNRQAAVMLYVHSRMGDAAPGEVDPNALGRGIPALYERIAHDADRYHGPYRIDVNMPTKLAAGQQGAATIRVRAASGVAVPGVGLQLTATNATAPKTATTDPQGVAHVTLTTTTAGEIKLVVRAPGLASTLPVVYAPSTPAAARNGQRIVAPTSQVVTGSGGSSAAKAQVQVTSIATPATVVAGGVSRDRLSIRGAASSFKVSASASLFGPFRSQSEIDCGGTPFWTGSVNISGSGDYTTGPVKLDQTGWYVYQHDVPDDPSHLGATTPCTDAKERVRVVARPVVYTSVSQQTAVPGAQIFDTINVGGLAGEKAVVRAALYGPFPSAKAISCSGKPVRTWSINVQADGEYKTPPVTLTSAGYYTYHESLDTSEFVQGAQTKCGETTETTVVGGVSTLVSAEVVFPGASISDKVIVLGLGTKTATIEVQLFGPFATRGAINCSGTPYWHGTVTAHGDGVVRTQPVRVAKAGFYTFHENIVGSPLKTGCAEVAETSLARPLILTGRGDPVSRAATTVSPSPLQPTRVRVPALDIDAPVYPVKISVPKGALDVPPLIHRAGWWLDGMTPGSRTGSTLIAGHVDSAKAGLGAFGPLREARPGQTVQVTTKNGQRRTYRIVSVQVMLKEKLPPSIYSRLGRPRLTLVTCGGPFDPSVGHYRDNVVVTAVPA
jgi:sortase family protein